jgi:hypothetical protein
MARYLTQSDWVRIREFANTPKHAREPEMLVPGDDDLEEQSARGT